MMSREVAWRTIAGWWLAAWILATTLAGCGSDKQPEPGSSAGRPAETAPSAAPEPLPESASRGLAIEFGVHKTDFDDMLKRKVVRVLVPYSRTLYFIDQGTERGLTVEFVRDFETYVNKKYRTPKDKRPITVVVIPTTRDKLLSGVVEGRGDIAAGNLTVTPARLEIVDMVEGTGKVKPAREVVVTGPKAPALATLEDLSDRVVATRPSSSYFESLEALSARLARAGKKPVRILPLPDALEDEDALEMVNAGLLDIVVVDDWKADLWAQVLPSIRVHDDLVLRDGGRFGVAIRKGSPELAAAIRDFYVNHIVKQGVGQYRHAKYLKDFKQIQDSNNEDELKRFEQTVDLFRKYGSRYQFDPLMLAAQGFQESRLDQQAKSGVGAIGVMQIMPKTGKELEVGDIRQLEPNIHGGAKYLDQLMSRYFQDAEFNPQNHSLFAFAAYNAGPGRIQQMRKLAEQRGLDPNVWFNNVEIVTAETIGMETTTYVRNIYKYYVSYKLIEAAETRKQQAQRAAEKGLGGT
jgi:membrane-bound lytic murein transglycosylase MltF